MQKSESSLPKSVREYDLISDTAQYKKNVKTLSAALTLAPSSNSLLTQRSRVVLAAQCSAVVPSCMTNAVCT